MHAINTCIFIDIFSSKSKVNQQYFICFVDVYHKQNDKEVNSFGS